MSSQDGYIFGYPIDNVLNWVNVGYLVSVGLAAAFSVAVWRLSSISGAVKDQEIASAKQAAADANERATKLESANLQLEMAIAPRRINSFPKSDRELLAPFGGTTVRVISFGGDGESAVLGIQILEMLTSTQIIPQSALMTESALGSVTFGVLVSGSNQLLVNALLAVFGDLKISAAEGSSPPSAGMRLEQSPALPAPDATIFVGLKPLPQ